MPRPSRSTGGHWRSGRKPGGRRIRRRLPLLATWGSFTALRASMPRQSRSTSERWRSGRRPWGRNTRTWRSLWMLTPRCFARQAKKLTQRKWKPGQGRSEPSARDRPNQDKTCIGTQNDDSSFLPALSDSLNRKPYFVGNLYKQLFVATSAHDGPEAGSVLIFP